jgi:shikimate kinase
MTKNSIALIGFMATGKTTVGRALIKYLGKDYQFVETDEIVTQEAGKSIPRIFKEDGESTFRQYEISACEKVSRLNQVVISCGGGVVLNKRNIINMKKNCHIVLLTATLEEIYKRSEKDGLKTRPIIDNENPKKEIEKVLNHRRLKYKEAAEIIIDTTKKEIRHIVREIVIKPHLKT